jgi:ABC-type uncharacterized transport system substrate-binding protein
MRNRRQFVTTVLGSAAAWPLAARAQQAMPIVGFLNASSPDSNTDNLRGFRQGLKEAGYVEGENATVEYRWAENVLDRLPQLAAELVKRRVAVIVAGSPPAVFAARAATTSIPIVFGVPDDPVKLGLVASLARPGGNLTGINFFTTELAAKRLEFLRMLVPRAIHVTVLANRANATITELTLRDLEPATRAMGLKIQVLNADTAQEIDAAFANLERDRPDAIFVNSGPFFISRRVQLTQWAGRLGVPATYGSRPLAEVGGLMSYGTNRADSYRQIGIYTGRILKGAEPADLPVVQATKFELVINHQTARMLGLTVPPTLLSIADEVIE